MLSETLEDYDLGGINCELCSNTGCLFVRGPGLMDLHAYECSCMKKRRSLRSIRKAGMADMASRYTFDSYRTNTQRLENIKRIAQAYIAADKSWFFISGQSGSGKTHICTAICLELMAKKASEIYFMPWRDESTEIKNRITDQEWYQAKMQKLKRVPVLYIDDFLKGGANDADIRLAFEILNARYNDIALRTVISSELPIDQILGIDEALGGRIYERSKGFTVRAPAENWRLRDGGGQT